MEPDLHLDPDALAGLAAAARRVADGLPPCPAGHPLLPVRRAAAGEMIAFAEAAERAVAVLRDVDDDVAAGMRRYDEIGRAAASRGPR